MRKQKKEAIWKEDEYSYPMAFGFIPNIMAGSIVKQAVIVMPYMKQGVNNLLLFFIKHDLKFSCLAVYPDTIKNKGIYELNKYFDMLPMSLQ